MAPDPKRSMTSYATNCNGKLDKAYKFLSDNASLTSRTVTVAESHSKSLEDQFSKMENKWQDKYMDKLMDENEELYEELSTTVKDMEKKIDKCMEELSKKIKAYDLGVASGTSASAKILKQDNSYKPDILLTSNTLEEFNSWQQTFEAHHDTNAAFLAASTQKIKRVFLTSLIDSKLQDAMSTDNTLNMDTPIVGADSLLAWLRNHILRHSPLFIRRYQYSSCKQQPRESFGDWWTRKLLKAQECDLNKVKREDIEIIELICGINDPRLREEILKKKEPRLEELVALGNQFDTAAKLQKDNFNETIQVNKTFSDYKKSKNAAFDQKRQDQEQNRSSDQDLCQHCGYTPCPPKGKSDCPAKGKVCDGCGGKGHFRKVCRNQNQGSEKSVDSKAATVRVGRIIAEESNLDKLDGLSKFKAKNSHSRGKEGWN